MAKKGHVSKASASFHKNKPSNGLPYQPETYEDDDIWDALDPMTEVTADEIPIMSIHADPTQPRRIIPSEIRDEWDGDPEKMPEFLQAWAEMLYDSGNDIPIQKILVGQVEPYQYDTGESFVNKFIRLLVLASQIRGVGLNHRIGVRPQGNDHIIIHGERRWTAFHILNHFLPMEAEKFSNIPAKVAHVDAWTIAKMQAQENVREEPNAIGKARMYAKLLMVAYADDPEYKFDSPHAINSPTCDRPWYSQAKNLRIPRGMGGEFETALGISTAQMRQYSKLLALVDDYKIDNTIWNLADDDDWAEKFLREIEQYLETDFIRECLYRYHGNGIDSEEALREAIQSAKRGASLAKKKKQREENPYLNLWLELADGWVGRVTQQQGQRLTLEDIDGNINIANTAHIIDKNVTPRSNKPDDDTNEKPEPEYKYDLTETVFYNGTIPARIVTHKDGGYSILLWNGGTKSVSEDDLQPLDEDEYISIVISLKSKPETQNNQGSDNSSSLPPTPEPQDAALLAKVLDLISKPARYKDQPCYVLAKGNAPGMILIQTNTARFEVHIDELSPPAQPESTTVKDFMSGKADTPPAGNTDDAQSQTIGTTGDLILRVSDRNFINGIAMDADSMDLPSWDLARLYKLRDTEITTDDLPELLEDAYRQIEVYADLLKKKSEQMFKDIANQYITETTDD